MVRQLRAWGAILTVGAGCVACAGGRGSSIPSATGTFVLPTATPTAFVGSSGLTFASNRSVLLSSIGQTYQLLVSDPSGGTVSYSSGNTAVATVTPSGLVTATGRGVATITVASGSSNDTATVLVEETGANTVAITDTNVLSVSDTQVALKPSPETAALRVGQIIVSGDTAGVLARITGFTTQADRV